MYDSTRHFVWRFRGSSGIAGCILLVDEHSKPLFYDRFAFDELILWTATAPSLQGNTNISTWILIDS
ncbi:hypothetical protein D918_05709 [Trichuris suis]|nr:hypothetical protein D918_05709 [Trichuris suis]